VGSSSDGAPTNRSLEATLEETLGALLGAEASGAVALAAGPWGRLRSAAGIDSSGRRLQPTAHFDVGSVTKTFVAALALALVDEDRLGLDDHAAALLPARYEAVGSATLRSLLNHTSGLPDFFEDAVFAARWRESPNRGWTPDELIEISLALPRHEPGSFNYANSNYVLIGLVIESATRRKVGELLRKRILDPLGLSTTRLPGTATAAGGLVSTADDLARFLAALLAGEVLGESSLREMLTTVPCDWAESQGYGLGIEQVESLMGFERSPCGMAWGHVGLGQATTVAFTTRDARRQVVLMANAMLTSDTAWAALSRATWTVLCPGGGSVPPRI
jgi:D-alanyl-D-alanine carboxypeptidase